MSSNIDEIGTIVDDFNSTIFKILKICKKIEPKNVDLEWLCKQLSLAKQTDPLLIINRAKDKIWNYREYIIEKNSEFFMKNDFSKFIKEDENKEFMQSFIELVKKKYRDLSEGEKELIWDLSKSLLRAVTKYKRAVGDFVETS